MGAAFGEIVGGSTKCLVFSIQNASRFERFSTFAKGRVAACRFHGRIMVQSWSNRLSIGDCA